MGLPIFRQTDIFESNQSNVDYFRQDPGNTGQRPELELALSVGDRGTCHCQPTHELVWKQFWIYSSVSLDFVPKCAKKCQPQPANVIEWLLQIGSLNDHYISYMIYMIYYILYDIYIYIIYIYI